MPIPQTLSSKVEGCTSNHQVVLETIIQLLGFCNMIHPQVICKAAVLEHLSSNFFVIGPLEQATPVSPLYD